MELDNEQNVINIATGSQEVVEQVVEKFNTNYKTNFRVLYSEDRGGVGFTIVDRGNSSIDEVFLLGFYYGAKVKGLRDNKEIDW